jgi:hypothetical protein
LIVKKVVFGLAAVSAIAAAAAVAVIAAAFALYALLRDYLGPSGAAAVVAAVAALLAALGGLICILVARPSAARRPAESASLGVRALDFARERPLVAGAAALALGLLAVRNPKVLTTAFTAFLAGKATPRK